MTHNVIDITKLVPIPKTPAPPTNQIELDRLIYTLKFGDHHPLRDEAQLNQTLLQEVQDFLIEEHATLVRESFGNRVKKKVLQKIITQYLSQNAKNNMNGYDLGQLSKQMVNEISGLGVFDVILESGDVTDVAFNGTEIWIKDNQKGKYKSDYSITSDEVEKIATKIARATGRTWNYTKPELDAELGALRINAMDKDIATYGVTLAIRKASEDLRVTEQNFVKSELGSELIRDFLKACIAANCNILITGETGTGKTELLKYLLGFTNDKDRINLLEDTREMNLKKHYPNKDIMAWRTRSTEDMTKSIGYERLLRSSLRSDPEWIVVSETRGGEALDMIKAGMTGHRIGTSLHSKSAKLAPNRLITMAQEKQNMDNETLGTMITDVFDLGIHIERDQEDGTRRIVELVEFKGFRQGTTLSNTIFEYGITGTKKMNVDGRMKFRSVKAHTFVDKISEDLSKKLLDANELTETLIPLLPEQWARDLEII